MRSSIKMEVALISFSTVAVFKQMIISQKCVLIIIVRPRHKLWNHTRDHQIKLCIQKRIHTQNMSSQFHDVMKNQNHRDAAVTLRTLSFLSMQWGNVRMRLDMPPSKHMRENVFPLHTHPASKSSRRQAGHAHLLCLARRFSFIHTLHE